MGTTTASKRPTTSPYSWRVVDIIVAAVISVACGVVFWGWSTAYIPVLAASSAFPPLIGLYSGGWLIAGVIGGLIIRKPGAALFCELLAAVVEGGLGAHFGMSVVIYGLVQGLGAELGFAIFRYRRFGLPVAILSGALAGVALTLLTNTLANVEWAFEWKVVFGVFSVISGIVIAGIGSWAITRALAKTGALDALASGRASRVRV